MKNAIAALAVLIAGLAAPWPAAEASTEQIYAGEVVTDHCVDPGEWRRYDLDKGKRATARLFDTPGIRVENVSHGNIEVRLYPVCGYDIYRGNVIIRYNLRRHWAIDATRHVTSCKPGDGATSPLCAQYDEAAEQGVILAPWRAAA